MKKLKPITKELLPLLKVSDHVYPRGYKNKQWTIVHIDDNVYTLKDSFGNKSTRSTSQLIMYWAYREDQLDATSITIHNQKLRIKELEYANIVFKHTIKQLIKALHSTLDNKDRVYRLLSDLENTNGVIYPPTTYEE